MSRYILTVPDMSCMHCVKRIDKTLDDMGASNFEINLEEKTVILNSENIKEVLDVLHDAGYPATVREV